MDIQNKKIKEEFNEFSHEKLNSLVTDLVTNYKEMLFLSNAQETVKMLNIALEHSKLFEDTTTSTTSSTSLSPLQSPNIATNNNLVSDTLQTRLNNNIFYSQKSEKTELTQLQTLYLFEKLLEADISIINDDQNLINIITKSINIIYEKKEYNQESELIKFFNIPIELLTISILQEFYTLIKYTPNKKEYTLDNIRFKLTNLCYIFGNLFLNTFFKSHYNPRVRKLINYNEEMLSNEYHEYNDLIESFVIYSNLKTNMYFCKLFDIKLLFDDTHDDEDLSLDLSDVISDNSSPSKQKIEVRGKEYSYKTGQYFYNVIKLYFKASKKKELDNVSKVIIKNKLLEIKIKLGSVFLHSFKKVELFKENMVYHKNKETLLFIPNLKYFPNMVSNIIHQRPYFSYNTINFLKQSLISVKNTLNTKDYYIYNSCYTRENTLVHKNPDIILKPTLKNKHEKFILFSGNYYVKNIEKFASFVGTIDRRYYYNFLLLLKKMLDEQKTLKNFTFEQNVAKYENLFLLYKINTKSLLDLYQTSDLVHKRLLEHLFEYAVDFSFQDKKMLFSQVIQNIKPQKATDSEKHLWTNYNKSLRFFEKIYNKIFSYKLFLKGLLSECLIYAHFDYFIFDSFLDARGRHYLNGFFMNPQSYPLIKAFVKPYINETKDITKKQFDILKTITHNNKCIIESTEVSYLLKQKLSSYESYISENKTLEMTYIYSLFENNSISLSEVSNMLDDLKNTCLNYEILFDETLIYIKKYMTNLKKLYVLHSTILLYLFPIPKIINYYELDATASGLQMTSMVLRDASLGELCNLTLPANESNINNDVYTIFSQKAIFLILTLYNEMTNLKCSRSFLQICHTLFKFFHLKKRKKNINKYKILKFLTKFQTTFVHLLSVNYDDFLQIFNDNKWLIIKKYSVKSKLYYSFINKVINIKDKNDTLYEIMYNSIYIFGSYYHLHMLLNKKKQYAWFYTWLSGRDVFKKAIMTFGYNATSYRRKEHFFNMLLEQNKNNKTQDLFYFVQIMENIFIQLKDIYLPSAQVLRDFGKVLSNAIKLQPEFCNSIEINNGIFEINIKCIEQDYSSVIVPGLSKNNISWHTLQIKTPKFHVKRIKRSSNTSVFKNHIVYSVDFKALTRKFAPNFIHSMDAWLICLFKYKINKINEVFDQNLFVNHITNHDTFSITLPPILKYILMDIYKSLYFFDYLNTLKTNLGYFDLLNLWFKRIVLNTNIRKLDSRVEAYLGSPVTIIYHFPSKNDKISARFDLGATTNLTLNPFFVK